MQKLYVKKLHPDAQIPQYAHNGDSGFDLASVEDVYIYPGQQKLVKTGLAMAIPKGYEIQIRPRSGLALKQRITLTNSPGTIDSTYRGEIGVIIWNAGESPFVIAKGDRIAQAVLAPVETADIVIVDELDKTDRGDGGYGHTGV